MQTIYKMSVGNIIGVYFVVAFLLIRGSLAAFGSSGGIIDILGSFLGVTETVLLYQSIPGQILTVVTTFLFFLMGIFALLQGLTLPSITVTKLSILSERKLKISTMCNCKRLNSREIEEIKVSKGDADCGPFIKLITDKMTWELHADATELEGIIRAVVPLNPETRVVRNG